MAISGKTLRIRLGECNYHDLKPFFHVSDLIQSSNSRASARGSRWQFSRAAAQQFERTQSARTNQKARERIVNERFLRRPALQALQADLQPEYAARDRESSADYVPVVHVHFEFSKSDVPRARGLSREQQSGRLTGEMRGSEIPSSSRPPPTDRREDRSNFRPGEYVILNQPTSSQRLIALGKRERESSE